MFEVASVHTTLWPSEIREGRFTGAPVVELRVGGGLYVGGLIQMLAAQPGSDEKEAAEFIAEATGQVVHPPAADLNKQILASREREKMRDRQLSDLVRRLREIWEDSQVEDHTGYRWSRYELMEWLRHLTTSDYSVESAKPTCVVGGCIEPDNDVQRVYYRGQPEAAWMDLCAHHREMFVTRQRSVLVEGWDVVPAQDGGA